MLKHCTHTHTHTLFIPPANRYGLVSRGRGRRTITLKSSANIKLYVYKYNIMWTGINITNNQHGNTIKQNKYTRRRASLFDIILKRFLVRNNVYYCTYKAPIRCKCIRYIPPIDYNGARLCIIFLLLLAISCVLLTAQHTLCTSFDYTSCAHNKSGNR